MKNRIPLLLIYSRLVIGFVIILLSSIHTGGYSTVAIVLLSVGFLTDIFDGIIARQLNISTPNLRRLDSAVDVVFFFSVSAATYIQCPDFFSSNATRLAILLGAEVLTYIVSYVKFKKDIATHSIGAKIWAMIIVATLIQVILQCQSELLFEICFWTGILTRVEIIAIIMALKTWTNDVPSFYHSLRLRRNKEIKRNKLFNG
jgi:phosphatidylglycerophosphate synthase